MKRLISALFVLTAISILPACDGGGHDGHDHGDAASADAFAAVSKAVCVLKPTNNEELTGVTGTISFTQTKAGLLVEANVSGLKPDSKHGFHVHQWGDISGADGKATGGHYNPEGSEEHSLPHVEEHDEHTHAKTGGHAGDFGNLESDSEGNAVYAQTFENISLTGKNAVLGRAIIVHLGEDDGGQPTGNAGARVAQGVIGIANPE